MNFFRERNYAQKSHKLGILMMSSTTFNAVINPSDVLLQIRHMEHLGAERAMFAHIIMNFSYVLTQVE